MNHSIQIFTDDETEKRVCDARLVAIRWDVIPWAVVLDLDAPESEAAGAPVHRMWIVADGIRDLSWSLARARLPTGCFLTSEAFIARDADGRATFTASTLTPAFTDDGQVVGDVHSELIVRSQGLVALGSRRAAAPGEHGLAWQVRHSLASDEELASIAITHLRVIES